MFPQDATLVIYMPGRDFRALADDLIGSGIAPETPCVAVSKASTSAERVHAATLGSIENESVGPAPVILLVGRAIQVR
jgi:uroporphyrin-III C-methyltransferase